MRRWQSERNLMMRRWRQELGNHIGQVLDPVKSAGEEWEAPPVMACGIDCHCARGIGTMRKSRPYGCPNGRDCGVCHWGPAEVKWARHNKKRAAIAFELNAEGE